MRFDVYTVDQSEEWDFIVRSFSDYDIYWLSGYVKAFAIHGDGVPLLFYFEDEVSRGINVVMKRDIANDNRFKGIIEKGCYYDFATPYGYGGWLIEGRISSKAFEYYTKWIQEHDIISEFVRFHPLLKNHIMCSDFYDVVQLGEVVHMDLSSPEIIWNNITSKNRNMIRKASKSGIKIYNGRFPEIYEVFREIYNSTMDRDNAEKYYYFQAEFYKSILEDLSHNAQVFWAELKGKPISASIILSANKRINYHLSGSVKEYSSLAPTNLLLYEVAMWGWENGYESLYLGGGVGSGEDSLFKFKRAFFKGDLNRFFIGKKIHNLAKYEELINMRDNINNQNFFPKYRG